MFIYVENVHIGKANDRNHIILDYHNADMKKQREDTEKDYCY